MSFILRNIKTNISYELFQIRSQWTKINVQLNCFSFEFFLTGILDIPVHSNRIHALHVLFTLFSEFKNSQVS